MIFVGVRTSAVCTAGGFKMVIYLSVSPIRPAVTPVRELGG